MKRQQQTFCFLCDPEKETIGTIKQRVYTILTQQHPMKDVDVHIHSISDLRIVIIASSVQPTTVTSEQEQQQQHSPPLVLLDADTLEYVQRKQAELTKSNTSHNNSGDGDDPNQKTATSTTTVNENNNNNNQGMVLYLLLPIVSGNDDDANTAVEEWETIQVVSTDI